MSWVEIPAGGDALPAYIACPEGDGPFPLILVIQEIFGVNAHFQDLCRRFAAQGFFAVAPELYFRQGDPRAIDDIPTLVQTVVSKVPDSQVMADLDATTVWAMAGGKADAARLAITGFCWGGRVTWLYAAHNPRLKAGVAWYGRLVGDPDPLHPKHPIDLVSQLKAPVLGLYGGDDQGIPVETVEKMRAAMKAAGKPEGIILYDATPHAFFADYRPSYREGPAKDAWEKCLAFLRRYV